MTLLNNTENPVTIFVASWGRPIYLWMCLDALWRNTKTPKKVILLDNAHPDPLITEVIKGFERRGLFSEVIRFSTNSFENIINAYQERLKAAGEWHVYMESDVVIKDVQYCWLTEMLNIVQKTPSIGMLGSLIDTEDFIDKDTAIQLAGGNIESATFLAKLNSAERKFANDSKWINDSSLSFPAEIPCPIGNPPGRLMMLKTDVILEQGFSLDMKLAAIFRQKGFRPAITTRVRHRHLSLLNLYDYTAYSEIERNEFFDE